MDSSTHPLFMPVHPCDVKKKDCPKHVPFSLLSEAQAYTNHSQTLKRLAERGGLSVREMLAVMDKEPYGRYNNHSDETCIAILNNRLQSQTK